MKVLIHPRPTPYAEVDPADVEVTRITSGFTREGPLFEAWGILKSERTLHPHPTYDITVGRSAVMGEIVDGPEYRIAYCEDSDGRRWQAEGEIERREPPSKIMHQIRSVWNRTHGQRPSP